MVTTQIIGSTIGNTAEVEANSLAMRGTLRPHDVGALGHYAVAGATGILAGGFATGGVLFAFRWGDPTHTCLVHRVTFSAGNDTVAFVAGLVQINMYMCRGFSTNYTGGTNLTPGANKNELATSFGSSLLSDARLSTTAALTAPAAGFGPFPDGDPTASLLCGVPAVAGSVMIPPTTLWDTRPGEHPIVFGPNEGFIIATGGIAIAGTGTWKAAVKVDWSEVTTYP